MKEMNALEQKQVVGGWKSTIYCCNYSSGCLKEYRDDSFDWKNGKSTFSYWTTSSYVEKWYARYYGPYMACHAHDCGL